MSFSHRFYAKHSLFFCVGACESLFGKVTRGRRRAGEGSGHVQGFWQVSGLSRPLWFQRDHRQPHRARLRADRAPAHPHGGGRALRRARAGPAGPSRGRVPHGRGGRHGSARHGRRRARRVRAPSPCALARSLRCRPGRGMDLPLRCVPAGGRGGGVPRVLLRARDRHGALARALWREAHHAKARRFRCGRGGGFPRGCPWHRRARSEGAGAGRTFCRHVRRHGRVLEACSRGRGARGGDHPDGRELRHCRHRRACLGRAPHPGAAGRLQPPRSAGAGTRQHGAGLLPVLLLAGKASRPARRRVRLPRAAERRDSLGARPGRGAHARARPGDGSHHRRRDGERARGQGQPAGPRRARPGGRRTWQGGARAAGSRRAAPMSQPTALGHRRRAQRQRRTERSPRLPLP